MQGVLPAAGSTTELVLRTAARLAGLGVVSGGVAATIALTYRWYVRERVPTGLPVLAGVSAVAVYVGATAALGQVIADDLDVLAARAVLANLAAFAVGGLAAAGGVRVGDRLGTDLFVASGGREIDADIGEIVQSVGRVTAVELPEEVDDIVGYDPMPEATKEQLSGRRFLFPRRLTKGELRDRLVARLKTDYGVGHVDLELADDGRVDYLAIGSRAAGIGPTLPPATNAVAIRADPAHAASAGDLVQVWETDPLSRVLTGELRGVTGEVVTVAIDAADTPKLDPTERYKLVTLPVQDRPDREFASLLRAADETMATVTVEPGSRAAGTALGTLGVTVAAITREDEPPVTLPQPERELDPGDTLYVVATPEALRRVQDAVRGTEQVAGGAASESEPAPDDGRESTAEPPTESTDETTDDDGPTSDAAAEDASADERDPSERAAPDNAAAADADASDGAERSSARDEESAGETGSGADEPLDGAAFPDPEDLPGGQMETDETDGDPGTAVPGGPAFQDTDDLPGLGDSEARDDGVPADDDPAADDGTDGTAASSGDADEADDPLAGLADETADRDEGEDDLLDSLAVEDESEDLEVWDPDERIEDEDDDPPADR